MSAAAVPSAPLAKTQLFSFTIKASPDDFKLGANVQTDLDKFFAAHIGAEHVSTTVTAAATGEVVVLVILKIS